jgi:hypothetical protein
MGGYIDFVHVKTGVISSMSKSSVALKIPFAQTGRTEEMSKSESVQLLLLIAGLLSFVLSQHGGNKTICISLREFLCSGCVQESRSANT